MMGLLLWETVRSNLFAPTGGNKIVLGELE